MSFDAAWYASPYFLATQPVLGGACGTFGLTAALLHPYPPVNATGFFANELCYRGINDTPASCSARQPVVIYTCGGNDAAAFMYKLAGPGAGCGRVCLTTQRPWAARG